MKVVGGIRHKVGDQWKTTRRKKGFEFLTSDGRSSAGSRDSFDRRNSHALASSSGSLVRNTTDDSEELRELLAPACLPAGRPVCMSFVATCLTADDNFFAKTFTGNYSEGNLLSASRSSSYTPVARCRRITSLVHSARVDENSAGLDPHFVAGELNVNTNCDYHWRRNLRFCRFSLTVLTVLTDVSPRWEPTRNRR